MAQFNLLKKFEKEHGHVHVPMHYKNDKRLGHWVNVSRLASLLKDILSNSLLTFPNGEISIFVNEESTPAV